MSIVCLPAHLLLRSYFVLCMLYCFLFLTKRIYHCLFFFRLAPKCQPTSSRIYRFLIIANSVDESNSTGKTLIARMIDKLLFLSLSFHVNVSCVYRRFRLHSARQLISTSIFFFFLHVRKKTLLLFLYLTSFRNRFYSLHTFTYFRSHRLYKYTHI